MAGIQLSNIKYAGQSLTPAQVRGQGVQIRISGLAKTLTALRAFEPEIYKALNRDIRKSLNRVKQGAVAIAGGTYKVKIRNTGERPGGSITAVMGAQPGGKNDWSEPATKAVIFEFAAKGNTAQARGAIDHFQNLYGSPGRFLWATYDALEESINADITGGIRDAERILQAKLDAAGEAY